MAWKLRKEGEMTKRYKHDEHGFSFAYTKDEARRLEDAGWVLDETYGKPAEVRKPGRKPKNDDSNVQ